MHPVLVAYIPLWFAIRVQTQHERVVARHAADAGYETYLPLYRSKRVWSDRVKELELPLFATYVFCRFPYRERVRLLNIPGVRSIVTLGKGPTPVPDAEIAALKTALGVGLAAQPWPFLKAGQKVRIERGPLRGLEGALVEEKGGCRLVLSVELLQRSVAVELDREWITPAPGG